MIRRALTWGTDQPNPDALLDREWLVTNGLGGYASGSLAAFPTRRFHSLLVAALPAPLGRVTVLNRLIERVTLGGHQVVLGGEDSRDGGRLNDGSTLHEFALEDGLPVWRYRVGEAVLERRVLLVHMQNTVHIRYTLIEGADALTLALRPALSFRAHEGRVDASPAGYPTTIDAARCEITLAPGGTALRLVGLGQSVHFETTNVTVPNFYRIEYRRGYDYEGSLSIPCECIASLAVGASFTLVGSTENWESVFALSPDVAAGAEAERRSRLLAQAHPAAREGVGGELTLAADQFIIKPATRHAEAALAAATGNDARTVIAGYPWFTDWGRDTMISLEGLTLLTGRAVEAGAILRTFAGHVRDGLIPNMFPEGENEGLYHTADASLWFFHALSRYLEVTNDEATLRDVFPALKSIITAHLGGTRFGIRVDPTDGLLTQGEVGYQLTWMDAKVDGWVVTPRRGKAVELNALFYNALLLFAEWVSVLESDAAASPFTEAASRLRQSFNARFWYPTGQHLYDVIDGEAGDDAACRPNQLFAIALPHPVLDEGRWKPVLDACQAQLTTPVGLRTLAPSHPDYKATYDGDLRTRDAAYHQGTVWPWLLGPFVDAWRKVYPQDQSGLEQFMRGLTAHLNDACIGTVSEIFDAEAPFNPRGCCAQAWSVAEFLRCYVNSKSLLTPGSP
jgi:predicted glycogen debranching enzyme